MAGLREAGGLSLRSLSGLAEAGHKRGRRYASAFRIGTNRMTGPPGSG